MRALGSVEHSDPMRYRRQFRPEFSRLHYDRDLLWVVPFSVRYIIAISGERFAGKSVALNYLAEKQGFSVYSLSDELRRIAARRGLPLEPRSVLQDLGDEVRAEHDDPAFLARLALRRIHRDHQSVPSHSAPCRVAVGGFKRSEEAEVFEKLGNFCQLDIYAALGIRFKRALRSGALARELEHLRPRPAPTEKSFEDYVDRRDLRGHDNIWTEGYGQGVEAVIGRDSAKRVENERNRDDFYRRLDDHVKSLDEKFRTID